MTQSLLRAYYFLSFAAFGAYLPYFPRWLEARGVRGLAMGAILALLPVMSILSPPITGALADAFGVRGSLLRVASGAAAVGFGVVALTGPVLDGSPLPFAVLFLASALFALARSPIMLLADVLALESLGDDRPRYGEVRLWGSLGFLAAALGVGQFVDPSSPRLLPALVSLLFALSLVVSLALPRRAAPLAPLPRAGLGRLGREGAFLLCMLLSQASHSAYDVCYSLHLRDLGVSNGRVGVAWAVGVAAEVALLSRSSAILSRLGARPLIVLGVAGAVLRWLGIALSAGFWSALLLQPLHALSFAAVWIGSVDVTARSERVATARGIASAAMGIGGALGLVAWSELYSVRAGTWVFVAAAGVACTALVAALTMRAPDALPSDA